MKILAILLITFCSIHSLQAKENLICIYLNKNSKKEARVAMDITSDETRVEQTFKNGSDYILIVQNEEFVRVGISLDDKNQSMYVTKEMIKGMKKGSAFALTPGFAERLLCTNMKESDKASFD